MSWEYFSSGRSICLIVSFYRENLDTCPSSHNYILNRLHIIKCNGLFRFGPLYMCNHFGMFLNLLAHPHFALVSPCPLPPLLVHSPFLSHFLYTNNTLTSKQINQCFHLLLFLASITLKSIPCLVPTLISLLTLPCMVSMSLGGR